MLIFTQNPRSLKKKKKRSVSLLFLKIEKTGIFQREGEQYLQAASKKDSQDNTDNTKPDNSRQNNEKCNRDLN